MLICIFQIFLFNHDNYIMKTFVMVVVHFILRRLLYLAFSANLGRLLSIPHPGMAPLV